MPIARVKHWGVGDEVDANDLENEFNNITDQLLIEPFTATQPIDLNGQLLILDADADTLLDASTDDQIDVTLGGLDDFRFEANVFRALAGSAITLDDGNVNLTDGDLAIASGRVLEAKAADITSSATITVPTTGNVFDIITTTTFRRLRPPKLGLSFSRALLARGSISRIMPRLSFHHGVVIIARCRTKCCVSCRSGAGTINSGRSTVRKNEWESRLKGTRRRLRLAISMKKQRSPARLILGSLPK